MTLRTSALVAGVLGLVLLVVGLIADSRRPDADVVASHRIDTPVAVLAPEIVGYEPLRRIAVEGDGEIVAHTARTADAEAWLATREATEITGLVTWEEVGVRAYVAPAPAVEPSPSPSPSASPEPSPAPSPSPSPEAEAEGEPEEPVDTSSTDHWRTTWHGQGRLAVFASAIPAGETFVIHTVNGGPLGTLELYAERDPNDAWITPLIVWGAILLIVGVVGLLYTLIDLRPWQRKGEEWLSRRSAKGEPKEGSRRARRLAGAQLPDVPLDPAPADAVPADPATADPATTDQIPQADQKGGEK